MKVISSTQKYNRFPKKLKIKYNQSYMTKTAFMRVWKSEDEFEVKTVKIPGTNDCEKCDAAYDCDEEEYFGFRFCVDCREPGPEFKCLKCKKVFVDGVESLVELESPVGLYCSQCYACDEGDEDVISFSNETVAKMCDMTMPEVVCEVDEESDEHYCKCDDCDDCECGEEYVITA